MKATKKLLCMALAMTTIGTSAVHAQRYSWIQKAGQYAQRL